MVLNVMEGKFMDEMRLKTVLEGFPERKILVVGDFYLDAYWIVDKTEINPVARNSLAYESRCSAAIQPRCCRNCN